MDYIRLQFVKFARGSRGSHWAKIFKRGSRDKKDTSLTIKHAAVSMTVLSLKIDGVCKAAELLRTVYNFTYTCMALAWKNFTTISHAPMFAAYMEEADNGLTVS